MTTTKSGIDGILSDVMKAEEAVKKMYGKTTGRVKIANAKTDASYAYDKTEEFMRWNVEVLNNLKKQL